MKRKFVLLNLITGYIFGEWSSYEAAEFQRMMLDDWDSWVIDEK